MNGGSRDLIFKNKGIKYLLVSICGVTSGNSKVQFHVFHKTRHLLCTYRSKLNNSVLSVSTCCELLERWIIQVISVLSCLLTAGELRTVSWILQDSLRREETKNDRLLQLWSFSNLQFAAGADTFRLNRSLAHRVSTNRRPHTLLSTSWSCISTGSSHWRPPSPLQFIIPS